MQVKSQLQKNFSDFPLTSFWRLYIDGNRQSVGPLGFDQKEPGYLESLQNAFDLAIKNAGRPLTANFIVALHDAAVANAYEITVGRSATETIVMKDKLPAGLRRGPTSFGLVTSGLHQNVTKEGLKQLLERMAEGDQDFAIELRADSPLSAINANNVPKPITDGYVTELFEKLNGPGIKSALLTSKIKDSKAIASKIDQHIAVYNNEIAQAQSPEQKLPVIAKFLHNLEVLHPFYDANCRTFMTLLLPKLLIEQKLPLAILENPNRFDLFSPAELANEIHRGMTKFQALKTTDAPEAGHEQDTLYYLNDTAAYLLATQAAVKCKNWPETNEQERQKAIDLIRITLKNLPEKGVNFSQLEGLSRVITEQLDAAIYKKAFYQPNFFPQINDYGIHFDSIINRQLNPNALTATHLETAFTQELTKSAVIAENN